MLKIYNTKTKKIDKFIPVNENIVNMYVCGPTVYDHIHIGNARPVIFFDFVKTYLTYLNYNVKYVSNITDIDDKIIDKAISENIDELKLTSKYIKAFEEINILLNNKLPDMLPKATSYVDEMIKYINNLINKGYAYTTEDGVYFDVKKIKEYGSLSGQNLDELNEGVRITNELSKKDPKDFTLWKKTDKGLSFDSPWQKGRPGWHTECAVMNKVIFNQMIDIHGGGTDLVFPHHENEEAQSLAHDDVSLSKYWMHVARLDLNDEKMSKSLGNVILVKDLLKNVSIPVFRLIILGQHYRQIIKFNEDLVNQYNKIYDRIQNTLLKNLLILKVNNITNNDVDKEIINEFENHLNNDFNTPNVITLILDVLRKINSSKDLTNTKILINSLRVILKIFKIMPEVNITDETVNLYLSWEEARNNKDFVLADKLRQTLIKQGWL